MNLFTIFCYRNILSTSSPQQVLFRATLFLFRANLFFFRVTLSLFRATILKRKVVKSKIIIFCCFIRNKLLNSMLLSGFKFGWFIAMILYIARNHEFQIAHIPIWTSASDVDMKSCPSARVTYPPSCPVPHRGEGV